MEKRYSIRQAHRDIPRRALSDNKTRGGKCLIVAGSNPLWGCAVLCLRAAARSGAGYTYLFDPSHKFSTLKHPDFLTTNSFRNAAVTFQAIGIGPGFKDHQRLKKYIRYLAEQNAPVVLDAEGLNALAQFKKIPPLPKNWILTPHEGELARLLKIPSEHIRTERKKYLKLAQKKLGCIIILKGHHTMISDGHLTWMNASGNPSLAKAGTGDVLTGIITGFLSQRMQPMKAACLGVFIHGLAADRWVEKGNDPLSLLASDLIEGLPETLNFVRKFSRS